MVSHIRLSFTTTTQTFGAMTNYNGLGYVFGGQIKTDTPRCGYYRMQALESATANLRTHGIQVGSARNRVMLHCGA